MRNSLVNKPVSQASIFGMIVAVLVAGCATQTSLPPQAAVGLHGLRSEVENLKSMVDETVAALNSLVFNPRADLEPQYGVFSGNVARLLESKQRAKEQKAMTEEVVQKYFMEWDYKLKQLKSEEMRTSAAERRARSEASFTAIQQSIDEAKEIGIPFLNDLKDIDLYLKTDLTTEGLRTIGGTARRVIGQEEEVQRRLDRVIVRIDAAISA